MTEISGKVRDFATRPQVNVKISREIQAEDANGFEEATQRAVGENWGVLELGSTQLESD